MHALPSLHACKIACHYKQQPTPRALKAAIQRSMSKGVPRWVSLSPDSSSRRVHTPVSHRTALCYKSSSFSSSQLASFLPVGGHHPSPLMYRTALQDTACLLFGLPSFDFASAAATKTSFLLRALKTIEWQSGLCCRFSWPSTDATLKASG